MGRKNVLKCFICFCEIFNLIKKPYPAKYKGIYCNVNNIKNTKKIQNKKQTEIHFETFLSGECPMVPNSLECHLSQMNRAEFPKLLPQKCSSFYFVSFYSFILGITRKHRVVFDINSRHQQEMSEDN